MTMKKYLVTDNWDVYRIFNDKQDAAQEAISLANCEQNIEIYEIKFLGCAYVPDPVPAIEWEE